MEADLELRKLQQNRLLKTKEEIEEFEEALRLLTNLDDVKLIKEMVKGFDDETEQHEVAFGLIHGIEKLYQKNIKEGLEQIASSVPDVLPFAQEWVEILHYRILNHPEVRKIYRYVFAELNETIQVVVGRLLINIANEDPDRFKKAVEEILSVD